MLSTDKQTDKLTNATKNITSFAKEVITPKKIKVTIYMYNHQADSQLYVWSDFWSGELQV